MRDRPTVVLAIASLIPVAATQCADAHDWVGRGESGLVKSSNASEAEQALTRDSASRIPRDRTGPTKIRAVFIKMSHS
jgi:hypothetical protein